MTRSVWFILGAMTVIAAAALVQNGGAAVGVAGASDLEAEPARVSGAPLLKKATGATRAAPRDVEVRREWITITPARPSPTDAASVGDAVRPQGTAPGSQRAAGLARAAPGEHERPDDTLMGRARRALLGDGRYRPEPFPRVRDN